MARSIPWCVRLCVSIGAIRSDGRPSQIQPVQRPSPELSAPAVVRLSPRASPLVTSPRSTVLCQWSLAFSAELAEYLRDADAAGHLPGEEGITDRLVISLRKMASPVVSIHAVTKRAEAHIGTDWIWLFREGNAWYVFAVQAKKLIGNNLPVVRRRTGSPPHPQIERLVATARVLGHASALYAFYWVRGGLEPPPWRCCNALTDDSWSCVLTAASIVQSLAAGSRGARSSGAPRIAWLGRPLASLFCCRSQRHSDPVRQVSAWAADLRVRATDFAGPHTPRDSNRDFGDSLVPGTGDLPPSLAAALEGDFRPLRDLLPKVAGVIEFGPELG